VYRPRAELTDLCRLCCGCTIGPPGSRCHSDSAYLHAFVCYPFTYFTLSAICMCNNTALSGTFVVSMFDFIYRWDTSLELATALLSATRLTVCRYSWRLRSSSRLPLATRIATAMELMAAVIAVFRGLSVGVRETASLTHC